MERYQVMLRKMDYDPVKRRYSKTKQVSKIISEKDARKILEAFEKLGLYKEKKSLF